MNPIVTLPRVVVEADGSALPPAAALALADVRVQGSLSLPTLCELTYRDPPGPLSVTDTLTPGSSLRVTVDGHDIPLFTGQVTAVEHVYGPNRHHTVSIRAYDLLHRLRKRQSVRVHLEVTPRDLAANLAGDLGLTVEAEEAGPLWPRLIQHRQSDLELLVDVAERCGLYVTLHEDALRLVTLDGTGEALALVLGESLLEARLEINGDPACRTVSATGWDPGRATVISGDAGDARSGREVAADVSPGSVGGDGERKLVDQATPVSGHAVAFAQAELDARVAREVTFWGIADGDPRLRPGARVDVSGVAADVAGRYVLTHVTHTIDGHHGFVSELGTTPPDRRTHPTEAGITVGDVTGVDDPDGLGRVQVALPTFGDVDAGWLPVLSIGAGKSKGLMALPDIGDQVLILLAHGDPARGVVAGGLYGEHGAPDAGVENGAIQRYTLLTPGGQKVQLDDGKRSVRLEDSSGSYVELTPDRFRLHATTDLTIEAPGHTIAIRGKAVDFERA